jgi:hypothetical protein
MRPALQNGEERRSFPPPPLFSFFGAPKNGASPSPNAAWNECKAWFQADRRANKKPKKNLKTHNNQTHKP